MSLFESASLVVTPNGTKASKLYAVKPTDGSGDLTVTRATTARRYNSAGLIESVANNVPRLDYTNSSCPSILVEPQRTNTILQSENLATSWTSFRSVVTTNVTTSPAGNSTADKIAQQNGFVDAGGVFQTINLGIGTTYTYSYYAKADGYNWTFARVIDGVNNYYVWFNLATGVLGTIQGSATAKIQNAGNGWYRCSVTFTSAGLGNQVVSYVANADNSDQVPSPNSVKGIYVWGAQLEAGSYPTSYIPTVASSVTRNADVISKTGISSLIGQTEGTIFVEEVYDATIANNGGLDDTLVSLTDGTSSNLISIFHYGLGIGNVLFFIRLSGTTQVAISSSTPTSGTYKIALAYKNNDVVGYINGVQIATDTSATIPATSAITLVDPITTNAATKTVKRKNVAVWKTRLSNGELSTLTTI